MGVPILVDLALVLDRPIEAVIARRYVRMARRASRASGQSWSVSLALTGKRQPSVTSSICFRDRSGLSQARGSFNNQAGLARAVNETLTDGTEVFIAEMGTYGPGEIAGMGRWVRPKVATITAVGPVHLERFRRARWDDRGEAGNLRYGHTRC